MGWTPAAEASGSGGNGRRRGRGRRETSSSRKCRPAVRSLNCNSKMEPTQLLGEHWPTTGPVSVLWLFLFFFRCCCFVRFVSSEQRRELRASSNAIKTKESTYLHGSDRVVVFVWQRCEFDGGGRLCKPGARELQPATLSSQHDIVIGNKLRMQCMIMRTETDNECARHRPDTNGGRGKKKETEEKEKRHADRSGPGRSVSKRGSRE